MRPDEHQNHDELEQRPSGCRRRLPPVRKSQRWFVLGLERYHLSLAPDTQWCRCRQDRVTGPVERLVQIRARSGDVRPIAYAGTAMPTCRSKNMLLSDHCRNSNGHIDDQIVTLAKKARHGACRPISAADRGDLETTGRSARNGSSELVDYVKLNLAEHQVGSRCGLPGRRGRCKCVSWPCRQQGGCLAQSDLRYRRAIGTRARSKTSVSPMPLAALVDLGRSIKLVKADDQMPPRSR